jgi:cell wall-associated NlpC family hydrolase
MMEKALGDGVALSDVRRGDLVFWKGHVAIGLDETRIVHANGFHMAVAIEPLETALDRIDAAGAGRPTAFRRL